MAHFVVLLFFTVINFHLALRRRAPRPTPKSLLRRLSFGAGYFLGAALFFGTWALLLDGKSSPQLTLAVCLGPLWLLPTVVLEEFRPRIGAVTMAGGAGLSAWFWLWSDPQRMELDMRLFPLAWSVPMLAVASSLYFTAGSQFRLRDLFLWTALSCLTAAAFAGLMRVE